MNTYSERLSSPANLLFLISLIIFSFLLAACGGGNSGGASSTDTQPVAPKQAFAGLYFSPGIQEIAVPVYTNVIISSDTAINYTTVNNNAFYLVGPGGIKVNASLSETDGVVTLDPVTDLQRATAYTATVTTDVKDINGKSLAGTTSWTFTTSANGNTPPEFDLWKANMLKYGEQVGQYLNTETNAAFLRDATYYDGQYVFYQIANFTQQTQPWISYAERARDIYYGTLLEPNKYAIPGYWRFPHGGYQEWLLSGKSAAVKAKLIKLRDIPAFSKPESSGSADNWWQQAFSREIAYALETNMFLEKTGESRIQDRVTILTNMALKHIDIWVTGNWISTNPDDQYVKPFMTSLTASALIEYYERSVELGTPDTRVPSAVKSIADWLWTNMWVANVNGTGYGAFKYMSKDVPGHGGTNPAPDLNLLIAPYYAWLYQYTCDVTYKERADLIFAGGVKLADLKTGKRFNQNYRKSFKYLQWREAGDNNCH